MSRRAALAALEAQADGAHLAAKLAALVTDAQANSTLGNDAIARALMAAAADVASNRAALRDYLTGLALEAANAAIEPADDRPWDGLVRYDCDTCLRHARLSSTLRAPRCVDTSCRGTMRHASQRVPL